MSDFTTNDKEILNTPQLPEKLTKEQEKAVASESIISDYMIKAVTWVGKCQHCNSRLLETRRSISTNKEIRIMIRCRECGANVYKFILYPFMYEV